MPQPRPDLDKPAEAAACSTRNSCRAIDLPHQLQMPRGTRREAVDRL
jgi:hypothetical protein